MECYFTVVGKNIRSYPTKIGFLCLKALDLRSQSCIHIKKVCGVLLLFCFIKLLAEKSTSEIHKEVVLQQCMQLV